MVRNASYLSQSNCFSEEETIVCFSQLFWSPLPKILQIQINGHIQIIGHIQLLRAERLLCHPFLHNSLPESILEVSTMIFIKSHPKISSPLRGCPLYFFGLCAYNSIRVYMSFLTFFCWFCHCFTLETSLAGRNLSKTTCVPHPNLQA